MIQFPHNFLWGAATSAYQVEGNNSNSDWWPWEKLVHLKDHSGNACRHYELFSEDFNLAKSLNHTCHRLSVEWGRIEPEEGKFSSQEIEHYLKVILSLRERNIIPIVTLHHFTNPIWFARLGGWENKKAPQYFSRYAEKIVTALAGKVDFWVTINEPMVYTYYGYLLGLWPPQEKSIFKTKKVVDHLFSAHVKTYRLIHGIYKRLNLAEPKVSIAQNMQAFVSCTPTLRNKIAVYLRDKSYNLDFIEKSIRRRSLDFIGVNYYSRSQVELNGWGVKNFASDTCKKNHDPRKKNSLGWDIYPEGIYQILVELKKYRLPVFILENGISTEDDGLRWEYIRGHLKEINLAMGKGVKVLGYVYWSLLDNFEWDKGFSPRFGLIEVDYQTYKRTVRESAKQFAKVCLTGSI